LEVADRVFVPGSDNAGELAEIERALDELAPMLTVTNNDSVRHRVMQQIQALDTKATKLKEAEVVEPHYEYRGTGKTYAEVWSESEDKWDLLRRSGIKLSVLNKEGLVWHVNVPEDLRERLSS